MRRLLICVSIAVCCFANTWVQLAKETSIYHAHLAPFYAVAVPVLCLEAVIALALFGAWQLLRRSGLGRSRWLHYSFLAGSLVPLGIAAVALSQAAPFEFAPLIRSRLFWPAAFMLALPLLALALLRPFKTSRIVRGAFLYMLPALALIIIQGLRLGALAYPSSAFGDGPLAPRLPASPGPRVIWIIFDELSQNVAFTYRPAGLELPQFDKMRGRGFYATAASVPEQGTETSMPALTLGEQVYIARPEGPSRLMLRVPSHAGSVSWSDAANVFDDARRLGVNSALVGWFHPYGRILSRSLVSCYWANVPFLPGVEEPEAAVPLLEAMVQRLRRQVGAVPLLGHVALFSPRRVDTAVRGQRFLNLVRKAREVAADPSIRLSLIHLPVPHPPGFYDRRTGALSTKVSSTYVDNVALADRTLGELLRAVVNAGLARNTVIIVSGDHGWRSGWRSEPGWTAEEQAAYGSRDNMGVPFLVQFPGDTSAVVYGAPLNTIMTGRLVLDILSGHVTASTQIPDWCGTAPARAAL